MQTTNGTVLITGGRRGIGKGIAVALAGEGFAVAVNAEEDAPDLHETVREIEALGARAAPFVVDVSDIGAHEALLDAVETSLGPLTTLVNNAGVGAMKRGDPLEVTAQSYDRCQNINARAIFFMSQVFAGRLLARSRDPRRHHCIINITSTNAAAVAMNRAEYAVSKAAASMVTRCFAARLGEAGINVYEIQPGVIATDMTAPALDFYAGKIDAGFTITPRVGDVEDVGLAAATLATGRLAYSTGHSIQVDGGLLIQRY